ncbi:ice-binding family protein, partial [Maribacter sp. ACAM166]|uniref:ice-binding family protein n=1 Tax=Maribacter sp. ACAM166 TaxID=2508996 RepID=UPI0010FD1A8A
MNKKLLFSLTTICLLFFSTVSFSQTLELGTLAPFETFAGAGAITNEGTSAGDAGTNAGIISGAGFDSASGYTGTTYTNNPTTVQARIDLLRVYIHLDDVFVTEPSTHLPAFGGGETISPGVYSIGGAGSVAGALTLDGGGDPNAFFIMKFEGALTVGAGSKIILSNETRAANVFWISQGAISVAASSAIEGTLFAHPGAVTLGVNSTINGRLFTSEGAVTIAAGGEAKMPVGNSTIPIKCLSDCTAVDALDILGSLKDFALFTSAGAVANAATSGIVGDIGTNAGAISGFLTSTHTNKDGTKGNSYTADAVTKKAVIDLDNAYEKLMLLENTETGHTPAFGSGETINSGVYSIAGAGSLAGTITLDGQNDPNSIFVFKFAGAFSVAAQSRVILTNGAKRCNVFWLGGAGVATGAVSIGTFTYMKGTVISHGGACTAGANSSIEGRMLSTGGAIGFSTGVIYNDTLCFDEPVDSDPAVALVKTASVSGTGTLGDVITYTFRVENTGDTALSDVMVTDPMSGLTITGSPITSLEVGASSSAIKGTYTITQNDIDEGSVTNSALATAKGPEGNDITDTSGTTNENDTPTVTTFTQTPTVALVKTASVSGTGTLGDVITYTFRVENTGNTTLTNVVVTDPMVGLTITGSPITSLEAGDSSDAITGTYTITQDDMDAGGVTNSALATAKGPEGNDITDTSGTTNENDTPTVTTFTQTPTVALIKSAVVSGTG